MLTLKQFGSTDITVTAAKLVFYDKNPILLFQTKYTSNVIPEFHSRQRYLGRPRFPSPHAISLGYLFTEAHAHQNQMTLLFCVFFQQWRGSMINASSWEIIMSLMATGWRDHIQWQTLFPTNNSLLPTRNFMHQAVTSPTRYRTGQLPSILNLVFSTYSSSVYSINYLAPLGKSDHATLQVNFV